jgi:hypothetical protein
MVNVEVDQVWEFTASDEFTKGLYRIESINIEDNTCSLYCFRENSVVNDSYKIRWFDNPDDLGYKWQLRPVFNSPLYKAISGNDD